MGRGPDRRPALPQARRSQQASFHGDYIAHSGGRSATLDASTSLEPAPWACCVSPPRKASAAAASP